MTGNNGRFIINEPTVVHENIEGETVILNLDTGNYYSVVDVGADIWDLIIRGKAANDIVSGIRHKYECSGTDTEKVLSFLEELQQEGLIIHGDGNDGHAQQEESGGEKEIMGSKSDFHPPVLNKYTDMQDLLLLDPIHEVDATGWPSTKVDT